MLKIRHKQNSVLFEFSIKPMLNALREPLMAFVVERDIKPKIGFGNWFIGFKYRPSDRLIC